MLKKCHVLFEWPLSWVYPFVIFMWWTNYSAPNKLRRYYFIWAEAILLIAASIYLKFFVNNDIIGLESLIVGFRYISLLGPRCDCPDVNCITFDTVGCCQHIVPVNLESNKNDISWWWQQLKHRVVNRAIISRVFRPMRRLKDSSCFRNWTWYKLWKWVPTKYKTDWSSNT